MQNFLHQKTKLYKAVDVMNIKAIRKLNKTISTELGRFGIHSAKVANDWCYYPTKERIDFKIEETTEDKIFMDFVKERFGFQDKNYSFILSILHEVGHHKTIEDIDGYIYNFCEDEKARIVQEMQSVTDIKTARILEYQYFSLPDEIVATAWAIDFIKAHPRIVKKMQKKFSIAILQYWLECAADTI